MDIWALLGGGTSPGADRHRLCCSASISAEVFILSDLGEEGKGRKDTSLSGLFWGSYRVKFPKHPERINGSTQLIRNSQNNF